MDLTKYVVLIEAEKETEQEEKEEIDKREQFDKLIENLIKNWR